MGRARATGFLNGSLPGSSAAAAVVNLYSGHPGTPYYLQLLPLAGLSQRGV